jgi:hypothetical protein
MDSAFRIPVAAEVMRRIRFLTSAATIGNLQLKL